MAFTVGSMRRLSRCVRILVLMIIAGVCASTSRPQERGELDSAARARIMQARASMVLITAENESGQTISRAAGFFIRKDLVATDIHVVNSGKRLRVAPAIREGALKVSSLGNYFLPYLLMERQEDVSPLELGDSESVTVNTRVYAINDSGAVSAGRVDGTSKVNNTPVFVISLPVDGNNRGAPIFNSNGEVIGVAAESPDGSSPGLAFPSSLLATLKHLGEPGVGAGAGPGRLIPSGPAPSGKDGSTTSQVDTKPVLLSRPALRYTEAARNNRVEGTVLLRLLVGLDGDVKQVRVLSGLPDGLNEQAIEAARLTKFKPATKDGKPVPYWISLQLEFRLQ
jgi:TonB family protein